MGKGISYSFLLLTLSYILFWTLEYYFGTNTEMLTYLLAIVVTHLFLDKNEWLVELLYKKPAAPVMIEEPDNVDQSDYPKVTNIHKNILQYSDLVDTVNIGEKFDIDYNRNHYQIRRNKNGYFLTRETDGYTQVFKSVDDLYSKGKIDNKLLKDIIDQAN